VSALRSLVLSKCGMKTGALYQMAGILSKNTNLTNLDLSYNNFQNGHNPKLLNVMFSSNKCLETVNFNESMLGDASLASIAKGF
jgi:hypothetical protein